LSQSRFGAEAELALVNVGSTILPILFKDALKASAIFGLRMESRSPLSDKRTCIMKPKDFLRSVILIVALSAFGISSGVTSDNNEAKHSRKITKARAERIALTKVPGGSIRSAELQTARGQRFWAVYVVKPGSKNAKEIHVDASSGQILTVQTQKPGDQAEEPRKNH
jgi:hypothetical protein